MKQYLLSSVALVALGTAVSGTAASGADLAVPRYTKAPPMMASPAYNWSGFYAGLQGGGIDRVGSFDAVAVTGPASLTTFSDKFSKVGSMAGGQIGYNYQSGMSVFGIEADAAWVSGTRFSSETLNDPFFNGKGRARFSSSIDWLATLRGRVGITPTPALLLYVTGGLAVAGVNVRYDNSEGANAPNSPLISTFSATNTKFGWTAGVGAEYALGVNWSIKAEYLHVKLDDASLNIPPNPITFPGSVTVHQNIDLIRAGLNYKFGGPMLARY